MQPRLTDQTQLYLRLSLPDVKDLRETLLNQLSSPRGTNIVAMYSQDGDNKSWKARS